MSGAFMLGVLTTSYFGSPLNVAVVEVIFFFLAGALTVGFSVRGRGVPMKDVAGIFVPPAIASCIAMVPAWIIERKFGMRISPWIQVIAFGVFSMGLYAIIVQRFLPEDWKSLTEQFSHLAARFLRAKRSDKSVPPEVNGTVGN